ncbi:hypothetical protein MFLAVUS_009581 [Mucor flavus]|uniref:Uncharacterized protein n=1 Tax=Mucor flavus TaxID=439312 RepID=A0ABP9ZAH6_9FUNG
MKTFENPENHGVLRSGESLSARPTMPKYSYQTLVTDSNKDHPLSDCCISDLAVIDGIIQKMIKKDDSAEELQSHKLTIKLIKQMIATMQVVNYSALNNF